MKLVCNNVTILEAWKVVSSQLIEFVVVGGTAEVQVRDPCTLTIVVA